MSHQTESVFAVTTEPRMEIGSDRRGRATVSVSNRSGRSFEAVRARVVPEGGADPSWFQLENPVRRMAPGALEQFVVETRLPGDAPPGEYRFRLHVADEEIPDDHFATSPTVAFNAPAAEKEEKSRWPLWAAIAALVLVVVALGIFFATRAGAEPGLGEVCEGTCASGLTCEDGFCVGRPGFSGCADPADCEGDLTCSGGTCAGPLGYSPCFGDDECAEELTCDTGEEAVRASRPEPARSAEDGMVVEAEAVEVPAGECKGGVGFAECTQGGDECATGLLCIDGACREDPTGQSCTNRADCGPGRTCQRLGDERFCLRDKGQPCTSFADCVTLNCTGGECTALANGRPCSNGLQCASGNCEGGVCKARSPTLCGGRLCGPLQRCVNNRCVHIAIPEPGFGIDRELQGPATPVMEFLQRQQAQPTPP